VNTEIQSPIQKLFLNSPLEIAEDGQFWREEDVARQAVGSLFMFNKELVKHILIFTIKMLVAAFVLAVLTHASTWWVYLFVKTGSIYNDYMLAIVLSIVSLVAIFWDTKKVQSQK
jgi:hypothetical protein